MKGSSPPSPPNPFQVSGAQTQSNVNTALANAALEPNVVSPQGTTTTTPSSAKIGGQTIERPTQTITLSPQAQAIYDQQQKLGLQTGQLASRLESGIPTTPLDYSSATPVPTDINQMNKQAADAVYQSATQYLDPQFQQQEQQLRDRLQASGNPPGTPAYQQAMGDFARTKQKAYADARNAAITQGFEVGKQGFNEQMAGRQQQVSEANQLYSAPISRLSNLMAAGTGGNVGMPPAFSGQPGQIAPTDVAGNINQNYADQLGIFKNQQANQQANVGSLAQMAMLAAMA